MRVPSYRKHSSGQARVTINGKDFLLGEYGSPQSKEAYVRLITEYKAAGRSAAFGKVPDSLLMEDVLYAFLQHAKQHYGIRSTELANFKLALAPMTRLYGSYPAARFGPAEFKAVRADWLSDPSRSRQYVNKQMKRTRAIVKWAVGEGLMPPDNLVAIQCVGPLQKGRSTAKEATPVTAVDPKLVEKTLPFMTQVLADMVRFQQLTGCRPGEVCSITAAMVDRSGDVWLIQLDEHKTAYRGKKRVIYVGPKAQAILAPYLLRAGDANCFSPQESEKQRRAARHAERATPPNQGNRPGYSKRTRSRYARKPRKEPGTAYDTQSYGRAIRYACQRGKLPIWTPNQLRHSAATEIRKKYGLDAAQVILGHSKADVTQIYAARDEAKAIDVARKIG